MPHSPLTGRARELRRRETNAERRVWRWLRNRALLGFKFRRQVPVGNYVLDFYCSEIRLAIEIDGPSHDWRGMYDERRTEWLSTQGIRVVRLANEHVYRIGQLSVEFLEMSIVRMLCEGSGRDEIVVWKELRARSGMPVE